MDITDTRIANLTRKVAAAQEEFDMAITFHEIWKPAAYDQELHNRFGKSYATQAFLVTRTALRREMVLTLIRMWDTHPKGLRMQSIWHDLRDPEVVSALASDRAKRMGLSDVYEAVRADLAAKANEVIGLIGKYIEGGPRNNVLESLRVLRHERLAHRQLAEAAAAGATATDEEIEEFYGDNSKLIHILQSLVNAMAYAPEDTAGVFRFYAKSFWARFREDEKPYIS
jgi:AbiU2